MLRSSTRTFLLATCVIAAPALALAQSPSQQTSQQHSAQSGKFLSGPQSGQMRMADLRDADIYTDDNQKIG
ncbi:MAG: hypothetical protein K2Y29_18295, partial [Beijerinckiaceae bacterium]|nr:hypothetical protein [Beijerinckiaceae bacterium]